MTMASRRRRRDSTIVSNFFFQILLSFVLATLFIGCLLFFRLHNNIAVDVDVSSHEASSIPLTSNSDAHLHPKLPYLPIFPTIDNQEKLMHDTLLNDKPTIAGIAAILYRFLKALHASNQRLSQRLQDRNYRFDATDLRTTYYRLVQEYLLPLEDAYRGRSLFPIRTDDSIFLSVAAFREHLLDETLSSAFGSASHPDKLFVGVVVNNCFSGDCQDGVYVAGKDKNGRDKLKKLDHGIPDRNGVELFCRNITFAKYCENGQVRALYVNETDALGPAPARYYNSKLWGGETYFCQVDAHLHFANGWDELYVKDLKLAKSYPKAILSTYPPSFINFRQEPPYTPGTRLCRCRIRQEEDFIPRVEMEGRSSENETRPTQMPFVGAGFFFAAAQFLVDIPFDPFLPWLFMGEEVALSVRAWTQGWNMYAPRSNLIGHQYRPIKMGSPHFQDSVKRLLHRPAIYGKAESQVLQRVKHLLQYPGLSSINEEAEYSILFEMEHYGVGTQRSVADYLAFAEIDLVQQTCGPLEWCRNGDLE